MRKCVNSAFKLERFRLIENKFRSTSPVPAFRYLRIFFCCHLSGHKPNRDEGKGAKTAGVCYFCSKLKKIKLRHCRP